MFAIIAITEPLRLFGPLEIIGEGVKKGVRTQEVLVSRKCSRITRTKQNKTKQNMASVERLPPIQR